MNQLEVPPHDASLEEALLGAMMGSHAVLPKVIDVVDSRDFYRSSNAGVYEAIQRLYLGGREVDYLTVRNELDEKSALLIEEGFMQAWVEHCPAFSNALHYAEELRELRIRRDVIAAANVVRDEAYHPGGKSAAEILETAEEEVFAIRAGATKKEGVMLDVALLNELQRYDDVRSGKRSRGISSTFLTVDDYITAFQPGNLIILAARPSVGKSALAMNIATRVSSEGHFVAFYSMEMTIEELCQRVVAGVTGIGITDIRAANLTGLSIEKYIDACKTVGKQKTLLLDEDSGLTITSLRSKVRRLAAQREVGLVVIDYLQLMGSAHGENRQQEVASMSRALKKMALDFHIPILCLSQLSRLPKDMGNREPILSDLRDSGAIEQDADIVLFLHRHEPKGDEPRDNGLKLICAKNRQGPIGGTWMNFIPHTCQFHDREV